MVGETGAPDMAAFLEAIRKLRRGDVVRLNVSGDYLGGDGRPDMAYIEATNRIPPWVDVLSYTHAWRQLDPAWFLDHVRPNASCETVEEIEEATAAGWPTVIVDADGTIPGTRTAGRLAVSCAYESHGRVCLDCRLCSRGKRSSTVVFQVHGARKRVAAAALVTSQPGAAAA